MFFIRILFEFLKSPTNYSPVFFSRFHSRKRHFFSKFNRSFYMVLRNFIPYFLFFQELIYVVSVTLSPLTLEWRRFYCFNLEFKTSDFSLDKSKSLIRSLSSY